MHLLAGSRMNETDGLRLEIETVSLCAIEFIANDWTAKTVWVGAVHSKLVCTSGSQQQEYLSSPPLGRGWGWVSRGIL